MKRPSGENAVLTGSPLYPSVNLRNSLPVPSSHSLAVPSSPPESARRLSGEKAADFKKLLCPVKLLSIEPVAVFHSLTVLSRLPERMKRPSREIATDVITSKCPICGAISAFGGVCAPARVAPMAAIRTAPAIVPRGRGDSLAALLA